jgi:hypothetical protein
MSQDEKEHANRVGCEHAGRTELGGTVAGRAGAALFFTCAAAYYVGAFLFSVWSWLALFGRVRSQVAEVGLVAWLALLVGLFHLVGVTLLKHWLILVVERISGWIGNSVSAWRERIRRNLARRQAVVEWDEDAVHCRHIDDEAASVRWADLEAVWVITTDRGPWEDDVFFVLKGTERECTVSNEALGMPGLIERLTQLPGFDEEAYFEAMCCTDRERFLIWRRQDGTLTPGDEGAPAGERYDEPSPGV